MSENIRVRSILGRFLEHSRIYFFQNANGAKPRIYTGSADWMARNFYRRIEVVFPIEQQDLRERVEQILDLYLKDNQFSTRLLPNGSYRTVKRARGEASIASQQAYIEDAIQSSKAAELASEEED